jgi:hypothetical protein
MELYWRREFSRPVLLAEWHRFVPFAMLRHALFICRVNLFAFRASEKLEAREL